MFKKKFRVRVKHFAKDKYTVQYAYYYLIPIYTSLTFWFEMSLTGNVECWSTKLLDHSKAEILAKSLKSIEDVYIYYNLEEAKEKDFYRRKHDYNAKHIPYDTKYF